MKYALSCLDGSAADAFRAVLHMHLGGPRVLDLTYGSGLSWGEPELLDTYDVVRSDLQAPYGQDVFTVVRDRPDWHGAFDLVYYDPPWFVDIGTRSHDPREAAYGGYGANDLERFIAVVPDLATLVRPGGKIIVKCGDQYHVPTRRLLLHHLRWCETIARGFTLVDFYVYRYHRVSPTAYQVKDRPCAIVAHSYFLVGEKVA